MNIPMVATNNVSYIEKEDYLAQQCLIALKRGEKLSDFHVDQKGTHENYLKPAAEMVSLFEEFLMH